jgi:hypothetical protein
MNDCDSFSLFRRQTPWKLKPVRVIGRDTANWANRQDRLSDVMRRLD